MASTIVEYLEILIEQRITKVFEMSFQLLCVFALELRKFFSKILIRTYAKKIRLIKLYL